MFGDGVCPWRPSESGVDWTEDTTQYLGRLGHSDSERNELPPQWRSYLPYP